MDTLGHASLADDGSGQACDSVTVLIGDKICTKQITRMDDGTWKVKGYGNSLLFAHFQVPINSIYDLRNVLTGIMDKPNAVIIRGLPKPGAPEKVRRLKHDRADSRAWFEEVARLWAMVDLDKVKVPDWADPVKDPKRLVKWLIKKYLPPVFKGVACVWQWSSRAGMPGHEGAISVHLWFYFDRPHCSEELTAYFKENAPDVDPAPFRTVQPHYFASPIFTNMDDPLPQRVGLIEGTADTVVLPPIVMKEKKKAKREAKRNRNKVAKDWEECKDACRAISFKDLSYNDWVRIGLAWRAASAEHPDEGRELWLEKCREYPGNDEAESAAKWDECSEPQDVGAGTIYHLAREAGWDRPLLKGFQWTQDGKKIRQNGHNVRLALEKLGGRP